MVIKVSFEGSNFVVRNMTKGSPVKLLLAFALPLLVANVFQQLYSVAVREKAVAVDYIV